MSKYDASKGQQFTAREIDALIEAGATAEVPAAQSTLTPAQRAAILERCALWLHDAIGAHARPAAPSPVAAGVLGRISREQAAQLMTRVPGLDATAARRLCLAALRRRAQLGLWRDDEESAPLALVEFAARDYLTTCTIAEHAGAVRAIYERAAREMSECGLSFAHLIAWHAGMRP